MKVRGAPLIGVTAAYSLAVITNKNSSIKYLREFMTHYIKQDQQQLI